MDIEVDKIMLVENFNQAFKAMQLGANKLIICSDLKNGGITPSLGTVKHLKNKFNVPIFCLVNTQKGKHIYDQNDIDIILYDIEKLINYTNIDGIVISCIDEKGYLDLSNMKKIIEKAKECNNEINIIYDMSFDNIVNLDKFYQDNIDMIIDLKCDHILTKGYIDDNNKNEAKNNIKKYIQYSNRKIKIVPIIENISEEFIKFTRCKAICMMIE